MYSFFPKHKRKRSAVSEDSQLVLLVDDAPSNFAAAENMQVSADKHSSYSAFCSPREELP